ncbi:AfsR/SARP family transcriptional regulator [Saccharothrix sp. NRRL B-16314]|uniref:AfsR/SARP family transcriptional regulator n=1 Tax=Saccharothrix sp. NRRL B-16314 TaxID=1463825 RepID=UPI00068BE350|nr:BTAD domain-containing putative transcriptional regulator [Saccharothrix sp. NRRL B-16314]
MRLDVFGRVRLLGDDGREIGVARGKMTVLLLVLAASRGQIVTLNRLVQALWGDMPPRTSIASLHNYVSALRGVLAQASPGGQHRLRSASQGYQLDLEPHECDLVEFKQLAAEGQAAARQGDQETAVLLLRSALKLWPGDGSLGGGQAASSALVDEMAQRWAHAAVTVHEDCLAAEIELGRHGDVVMELRELVARYPLREQLRVLLMRALWTSGERAEALAVYDEARRTLVDELGLEPGPELTVLQGQILAGDPPRRPVVGAATTDPPRQLPMAVADFVGRDGVIRRLTGLFDDSRSVVTVCVSGQPGVGKTALVVHIGHMVASQFPDGQLYVNLGGAEGVRTTGEILGEMLRALGVPDTTIPDDPGQRAAEYRSRLAGRRVLVVLDDAVDEEQVRPLLPGTGGTAVLVSSRRMLAGLSSATAVQLGPLTEAEAWTLFGTILGAERVGREPGSARELVDLCGRLPLAIRVVASRLATRPHWSMSALAARMSDQHQLLDELTIGELDVRAGLAVSHGGLGELERVVFRRFALSPTDTLAPWALAALGGDVDPDRSTDRVIHQLLTSHLIEPVAGRYERYTMHDVVRAFALEQLSRTDGAVTDLASPARAAFRRLFGSLHSLVRLAHQHVPPPPGWLAPRPAGPEVDLPADVCDFVRQDPLRWYSAEIYTLMAVLPKAAELGWYREALDATERLSGFLSIRHRMAEIEQLASAVAAACGDDLWARARAGFSLAQVWVRAGRFADAADVLTRSRDVFEAACDMPALTSSLVLLSFCRGQQGDLAAAETLARRAVRAGRGTDEPRATIRALRQLGHVLASRGDAAEAVLELRRAVTLAEQSKEVDLHAVVLSSLSTALIELGAIDQGGESCRRAIELLDRLDQPIASAYLRISLGRVHEMLGETKESVELTEQAWEAFRPVDGAEPGVHAEHRKAMDALHVRGVAASVAVRRLADAAGEELGVFGRAWELDVILAARRRQPGTASAWTNDRSIRGLLGGLGRLG